MRTITAEQLEHLRDQHRDVAVINVLDKRHFEEAHIPGSKNIPVDEEGFAERVEREIGNRDRDVVVYCANESCNASPRAAEKLEASGFQRVYDFAGGTEAWRRSGKRVEGARVAEKSGGNSDPQCCG